MHKKMKSPLKTVENILKAEKFDCEILKPGIDFSRPRLSAFLGNDHKERERMLEIVADAQEIGQEISEFESAQEDFVKLEFRVFLPFIVNETSLQQTASMLTFLNRYTELPGFELIEEEKTICYRYVLFCESKKIDRQLCMAIISVIIVTLDQFTNTIELVSNGDMTFDDVLEAVLKP